MASSRQADAGHRRPAHLG